MFAISPQIKYENGINFLLHSRTFQYNGSSKYHNQLVAEVIAACLKLGFTKKTKRNPFIHFFLRSYRAIAKAEKKKNNACPVNSTRNTRTKKKKSRRIGWCGIDRSSPQLHSDDSKSTYYSYSSSSQRQAECGTKTK